jgi:adenylate cyclase
VATDWEAAGLLKGTRGSAREARRELLEQLEADGVPLEELRRAVEEERLALLPVERVLDGDGGSYTGREIAERAGIDLDLLIRGRRALGLTAPEPDERSLGDHDLDAATRLQAFRDAGLSDDGLLEISRVIGLSLSQVAAATRTLIAETMVRAGGNERDVALGFAEVARRLGPLFGPILEYALTAHLREQIRHDAFGRADIASGATGTNEITASFADMVGFTRLGEELEPDQLGKVTGRLAELAGQVARPPVRVVKLIGDAAMLVADDTDAVLEASLELVALADQEGSDFPILRAGVARGRALARGGDWYGRPVNLASRLTAVAYPGSVLCAEEVREDAGADYRWSFAGERKLRGIAGQVKMFRCRAPE